jgi:DNA processing protein
MQKAIEGLTYSDAELGYIALDAVHGDFRHADKAAELARYDGDAARCRAGLYKKYGGIIDAHLKALLDAKIVAVTCESAHYPANMLNVFDPPFVLYCKGNTELLTRPAVGIVGTRDCTRYGVDVAKRFAHALSEAGIVVVSGLASGIDTAAHLGAGANTIAVLGNGLNVHFPVANTNLQNQISEIGGLVISEYSPNMHGGRTSFPHRNRIIAALGRALIVVEADNKSGALITKNFALDLGAEVFAVPGPITSYASRGTNQMIKTAPCSILTDIQDVLDGFGMTLKNRTQNTVTQISFEARGVLASLGADEKHFDEIMSATKSDAKSLSTLLTNMELGGLILKLPGNFYKSALDGKIS